MERINCRFWANAYSLICYVMGLLGFIPVLLSQAFWTWSVKAKDLRLQPSMSSSHHSHHSAKAMFKTNPLFYPSTGFHTFSLYSPLFTPPLWLFKMFSQIGALWGRLREIKLFSSFSPRLGWVVDCPRQKPLSILGIPQLQIIRCRSARGSIGKLEVFVFKKMCRRWF